MRFIINTFKVIGVMLLLVLLAMPVLLTTIDHTPVKQMPYYQDWKREIADFDAHTSDSVENLRTGWAKVNITPEVPRSMAGYGKRSFKPYESVNDSVFVRALFISNVRHQSVVVASDLLITPPSVVALLEQKLKAIDIPLGNVFFGATHTHSSVGGWGGKIAGLL